eukprot:882684-Lingulodinium_polyedra.AAC.1
MRRRRKTAGWPASGHGEGRAVEAPEQREAVGGREGADHELAELAVRWRRNPSASAANATRVRQQQRQMRRGGGARPAVKAGRLDS